MKIFYFILFFLSFFSLAERDLGEARTLIRYVKNNTNEEQYNSNFGFSWEKKIDFMTEYWQPLQAHGLIFYLEDKIGKKAALERIKSLPDSDLFKGRFVLNKFYDRVRFYDEFLGQEEVTKKLKESFDGFDSGNLEAMQALTEFLEDLLGKETVISMMKKDLRPFSKIPHLRITTIYEKFSFYIGKKPAKELIKNNLNVFIEAKKEDLEQKLEFFIKYTKRLPLQIYPIEQNKKQKQVLTEIITSDFQAFVSLDLEEFEKIHHYLKNRFYLTDQKILSMAAKDLGAFSNTDLNRIQEVIQFIAGEIDIMNEQNSQDVLSKLIYEDPRILSEIDLENFKAVFAHLEDWIKKSETVRLMVNHFPAFYKVDFDELIEKISILHNLFGEERVYSIIMSEGWAFLNLKSMKLKLVIDWIKPLDEEFSFLKERALKKELLSFFNYMEFKDLETIKENAQKQKILKGYLQWKQSICEKAFSKKES